MAKKKKTKCTKKCSVGGCDKKKVASKNQETKKLKATLFKVEPKPPTFLQKVLNRITTNTKYILARDKVVNLYRLGMSKCKKLF